MYIAMNRFKVAKGREAEFETLWRTRESYLHEREGFIEFSLLKGAEREDHTLYSSHTVWAHYDNFADWTQSEQFRKAHARIGGARPLGILGHPEFEGFEVIHHEDNLATRQAVE